MNKTFKLMAIFLIFSTMIFSTSANDKNKEFKYNIEQAKYEESTSFYERDLPNKKKILDPVVKITRLEMVRINGIYTPRLADATGFSIKYDQRLQESYILTNYHFCEDGQFLFNYSKSDSENYDTSPMPSGILSFVYSDQQKDLCLLKAPGKIPAAKLSNPDKKLKQLDKIYIIGAPRGVFPIILETYFTNYVKRSSLFYEEMGTEGNDYLLISEIIYGGHSGSPIFNKRGEVVGIVFSRPITGQSVSYGGYGISLDDILEFLQQAKIEI